MILYCPASNESAEFSASKVVLSKSFIISILSYCNFMFINSVEQKFNFPL